MSDVPHAEQLVLPPEYGSPSRLLPWADVEARLVQAHQYWFASVRPDGRPHVVPLDGIWLDGHWYFGGSAQAVRQRNLEANPHAVLHLEEALAAVIVEGTCHFGAPTSKTAKQLAAGSKRKYGYGPPASAYLAGVWTLSPVKVMAWTTLSSDATRFTFG